MSTAAPVAAPIDDAPVRGMAAPGPLTIVHVAAPAPFGGLERVVHALAAGQAARGHAVHLAAILDPGADDHPLVEAMRRDGVTVHAIIPPRRAYGRERALIRSLLARLAPDVVHTHGYRADVLHGPAARRMGLATVATVHGFTRGGLKNRLYERLQRRAFRRYDAVVAVSTPLAAELVRDGVPAERLATVPNAMPAQASPLPRREARERLGIEDGTFAVGWVGRISWLKGLDVLIDALPLLADLPLRLVVIGDGPDRETLVRRAAGLEVGDRIDWRGFMTDPGRWMPAFDCFALSSRSEGTPMTLLEAIAARVPVVAAAVGGVPDVVTPAEAVLVPPERPDLLAAALRAVHAAPADAATRADRALARVEARFAPGPWLDAYESIYRRIRRAAAHR